MSSITTAQLEAVVAGAAGTFLSTAAVDVVGLFKLDTLQQVARNARPVMLDVKEESQLMEHPLEDGTSVVDHRILKPNEFELALLMLYGEYRELYQELKQLYLNAELLTLHTKVGVYTNLVIAAMPHKEDAEMYDGVAIGVKLREVQVAQTTISTIAPRNPKNKSTVQRGTQQSAPASEQDQDQGSLIFQGYHKAFG